MRTAAKLQVDCPRGQRSIAIAAASVTAANEPQLLSELLRQADLPLNTRCGQHGLCNGCLVELLAGRLLRVAGGSTNEVRLAPCRLRACQYTLPPSGDVRIRIPLRSLLAHEAQIVTSFRINVTRAHRPLWQPCLASRSALGDDARLKTELAPQLAWGSDEDLPIRAERGLVTGSLARGGRDASGGEVVELAVEYRGDHWLLRPRGRAQDARALGIAVDLGTTTVAAMLVDLRSGETLATASASNAQTHLGDNVLTRITLCLNDPSQVEELQRTVSEQTLTPLIDELLDSAQARQREIAVVTVAGNATMLHLLAGVNPGSMGMAPFTPVFLDHRVIRLPNLNAHLATRLAAPPGPEDEVGEPNSAKSTEVAPSPLRQTESPGPTVHLLPGAAAYVGADITAGVFSSGLLYREETCLLVDVGTNGEIVLKHGEHLIGCATAAGPAFEGGRLNCGVRAGNSAISHVRLVRLSDCVRADLEMIGEGPASGLCGTAYVDFIAQARRLGLIGSTGRIRASAADSGLLHPLEQGSSFLIAEGRQGQSIFISEVDIASLLQAKAAIAAGIICLLRRFGLNSDNVHTLYLAGGFGFHMDVPNLIDCGLLPGFRPSQVQVVGNTSLAGAYLALLDIGALEEIKGICQRLEIVELNLDPSFESHYIDQLYLGDAD